MGLPTRKAYLTFVASQLGVREVPDGSNRQRFGVAYGWNGVAWCQMFDWYCANVMAVSHLRTASTMAAVAQARKNGTWHDGSAGIQPGDSIYFHWSTSTRAHNQPDHVETCEKVVTGGVQTIGGNVSNMVHRQIRRANILGYVRHTFAAAPVVVRKYPGHVIGKGAHGPDVVWIQKRLLHHGIKLPKFGADGGYGNETAAAVHVFRAKQGKGAWRLGSSVGAETWKRLGL